MTSTSRPYPTPFYTRLAMILISLIALGYIFVLGKRILCPLLFSFLFAIVLLPVSSFFEKRLKLPRSAASGLAVIFLIVSISLIVYLVAFQISDLAQDWPLFKEQFSSRINSIHDWVRLNFHVNTAKQVRFLHAATDKFLAASTSMIAPTVLSLSSIL